MESRLLVAGLVALLCAPAWSQDIEEEQPPEITPAMVADGMKRFTKDVRFDEDDVKSFLKLYKSYDGLEDDDFEKKFVKDGRLELDLVVKDKKYAKWAADNGVDAKKWLQRTTRIQGLRYKKHFPEMAAGAERDITAQMKDLESMRKEIGEESYLEAKAEMEEALKMSRGLATAFRDFPEPNEAEAKLLAEHGAEIDRVLEIDDDGCGCDDDEEEPCGCDDDSCGCDDDDDCGCGCDDGCDG